MTVTCDKKSLYVFEPCLNVHFIDNTCYFLLSRFDLQEQVLGCLESCDQDVPPN